jgi:hypothetical protein
MFLFEQKSAQCGNRFFSADDGVEVVGQVVSDLGWRGSLLLFVFFRGGLAGILDLDIELFGLWRRFDA